jgi:hypothetical protein
VTRTESATDLVALEARIRRIEDRIALEELLGQYRSLADAGNYEAWSELFTEDCVFTIGVATGASTFGRQEGRQEIYEKAVQMNRGNWDSTMHTLINPEFHIEGDRAHGTVDMIYAAVPKGATSMKDYFMDGGRYDMQYARTNEGWRISGINGLFLWDNAGVPWDEIFGQQHRRPA